MTDVHIFHEDNGGNIRIEGGRVELTGGLESAIYLSMFGGNERDSGIQGDDPLQYWGNLTETDPAKKYRSETQNLLRSIPAIAANLQRIEEAAGRDLAWLADDLAESVVVEASIPQLNWVRIDVAAELQDGSTLSPFFLEPWGSSPETDS